MCLARFSELNSMKKHYTVHSGDKPYKCEVRLARFTISCNVKKHSGVHSGESHTHAKSAQLESLC